MSIKSLLLSKQRARHERCPFTLQVSAETQDKDMGTRVSVPKQTPEGLIAARLKHDNYAALCTSSFPRPDCLPSPLTPPLIAPRLSSRRPTAISVSRCHALHHPNLLYLPPSRLPLLWEADETGSPGNNAPPVLAFLFTCLQTALRPLQGEAKNLNSFHLQGCYCSCLHT